MYGTILPPPVWKDFSRLTRRGCVVYTPCCVQTVEFMLPSRSFPFNFIRNTRAIAILSMQIGWNGLASFLSFNPTCIPYVEEQMLRLIVFELLGEELKRASVFATTKPRVNWKFFAILDEVYYFQRYVLGWDWRAS